MTDAFISARYRLDGVIVTVDAVNGMSTLDHHPEAIQQAAVADRLLLTKTDLVDADTLSALQARLRTLNPGAPAAAAGRPDRCSRAARCGPLQARREDARRGALAQRGSLCREERPMRIMRTIIMATDMITTIITIIMATIMTITPMT
jgi:G3E family GTPase